MALIDAIRRSPGWRLFGKYHLMKKRWVLKKCRGIEAGSIIDAITQDWRL